MAESTKNVRSFRKRFNMVKTKTEVDEIVQDIVIAILGGIALLGPWAVLLWYIYQL